MSPVTRPRAKLTEHVLLRMKLDAVAAVERCNKGKGDARASRILEVAPWGQARGRDLLRFVKLLQGE